MTFSKEKSMTKTKLIQTLRRKPLLAGVIVISLAVVIPIFGKGAPKRLHFKKGEDSMTVRGFLNGKNDSASYLLEVKAHQTIEVRVNQCGKGNEISIGSAILDPSGKDVSDDHDMQGNNGVSETKVAGTYRIDISPSGKGATRGSFCIDISVTNTQR
jgi:hypothetical protein